MIDLYEEALEGLDKLLTPSSEAFVLIIRQPGGRIELRWGNPGDDRIEAAADLWDAFVLMDGGDPDELMN